MKINGLTYKENVLDSETQQSVLDWVDRQPWNTELKRRTQHYGYKYNYKLRKVTKDSYLGELPFWGKLIEEELHYLGLISKHPDQMIINEYLPGQGIAPHVDCPPCFDDTIATVSLGWPYIMQFCELKTRRYETIKLEVGSALIMRGESRYLWTHSIAPVKSDNEIPRQRRVSLTFRNVLLENL